MAKREQATSKTAGAPEEAQTFEAQLAALERIVRELERGDLALERSLELFEQGVRLSRVCQERLNEAERRIEVLLRDGDGQMSIGTLDDEDFTRVEGISETDDDESVF